MAEQHSCQQLYWAWVRLPPTAAPRNTTPTHMNFLRTKYQAFLTHSYIAIAMEYAGSGTLFNYVREAGCLREAVARWCDHSTRSAAAGCRDSYRDSLSTAVLQHSHTPILSGGRSHHAQVFPATRDWS